MPLLLDCCPEVKGHNLINRQNPKTKLIQLITSEEGNLFRVKIGGGALTRLYRYFLLLDRNGFLIQMWFQLDWFRFLIEQGRFQL